MDSKLQVALIVLEEMERDGKSVADIAAYIRNHYLDLLFSLQQLPTGNTSYKVLVAIHDFSRIAI